MKEPQKQHRAAGSGKPAARPPHRSLPAIDLDNAAFWTGGAQGKLLIHRCRRCLYYVHPPTSFCPNCESRDVAPAAVSGRGVILSLTVNHRAWYPGLLVPYIVAIVGIEEQPDVHLVTNIVDCDPTKIRIGDSVEVRFEPAEDLWIPLFAPAESR